MSTVPPRMGEEGAPILGKDRLPRRVCKSTGEWVSKDYGGFSARSDEVGCARITDLR